MRSEYDWATHDLFPAFKGDLRPWSESLDQLSRYYAGAAKGGKDFCGNSGSFRATCTLTMATFAKSLAAVFRNVPFMNTDSEDTRTIGHFNPMRPPYAGYSNRQRQSPLPYGTTHEFVVNHGPQQQTLYINAGSRQRSECAVVDHWLWQARSNSGLGRLGDGWDSGYSRLREGAIVPHETVPNLTPVRKRPQWPGHVEIQFRQYLMHSGTQPIVTANDPFWNIRAYDSAIAGHGGFVEYPLICAINQLVMDNVASRP